MSKFQGGKFRSGGGFGADKERLAKIKLIGLATASGILLIWVLINLIPMLTPAPRAKPLDTPGWNLVQELNDRLLAESKFSDVGFMVETERPLKLRLVGGVHSEKELEDLRKLIAVMRPEGDYEIDVEIIRPVQEEG